MIEHAIEENASIKYNRAVHNGRMYVLIEILDGCDGYVMDFNLIGWILLKQPRSKTSNSETLSKEKF